MLKTSLQFSIIAFIAFLFADIEVLTLDPWGELARLGAGLVNPDLTVIWQYKASILNTISFAFCGITLAIFLAIPLAFNFNNKLVRLGCAFVRAIHEIFWAFIFLHIVGLNALCGILAIAVPYAGIFAKVFAEIEQESDRKPQRAIPSSTDGFSSFIYGTLPIIFKDLTFYSRYRLECAIRSSAILGFIGLPTIGFYLETAFREGYYSEAAALLYIFFISIALLKYALRPALIPVIILSSFIFISFDIHFSWSNLVRFFTYEILPWPMRSGGFYDQSYNIVFNFTDIVLWARDIFLNEGFPGLWQTIILTQMALVGTGIFSLLIFPFSSKLFVGPIQRKLSHFLLIIMRTTPEYILAYILLQIWGPSMLPAVMAILLHNGAILAFLTAGNSDRIKLRFDNLSHKMSILFYEIIPRVFGQFMAFLFYRWEVMMRESAILGILGITTLGFYIDSAISDDQLDKAVLLILLTAILNMVIDSISQYIRQKQRISSKLYYTG